MYTFNHLYELSLGRSYHVPNPDPRFPGLRILSNGAEGRGALANVGWGMCWNRVVVDAAARALALHEPA